MNDSDHADHDPDAIEEAAEHADRAGQEREEMRRKASLAEATDDERHSDELERDAEAHREEAYQREDAAADRASDAD